MVTVIPAGIEPKAFWHWNCHVLTTRPGDQTIFISRNYIYNSLFLQSQNLTWYHYTNRLLRGHSWIWTNGDGFADRRLNHLTIWPQKSAKVGFYIQNTISKKMTSSPLFKPLSYFVYKNLLRYKIYKKNNQYTKLFLLIKMFHLLKILHHFWKSFYLPVV